MLDESTNVKTFIYVCISVLTRKAAASMFISTAREIEIMASRKTDIEYTTDGFTVALYPITKAGQDVWSEIATHFDGVAKFPAHMFASVKAQIKAAGYSIRKSRPSNINIDDLLAELDA